MPCLKTSKPPPPNGLHQRQQHRRRFEIDPDWPAGLLRLLHRTLFFSCLLACLAYLAFSTQRAHRVERLLARQNSSGMARVYADINANMPRSYWDYDSVNIQWGVLENYEVVRKIGTSTLLPKRQLR